jgi:hypothetical protein
VSTTHKCPRVVPAPAPQKNETARLLYSYEAPATIYTPTAGYA